MESAAFSKLHEVKLAKNVDRLIPYNESSFLAATYHLNKETQTKTGSLQLISVDNNTIKVGPAYDLDYGVLSVKQEGSAGLTMGCSDGSIRRMGDADAGW